MSNAEAARISPSLAWSAAAVPQAVPAGSAHAAALAAIGANEHRHDAAIVNLADVLEMAVALNQNAARNRDVRLHCYCLEQLPVREQESALLDVLDRLLGSAVQHAVWGSLVLCEAAIERRRIVVRIRYARPASAGSAMASSIAWTDLVRAWPIGQSAQFTGTEQGKGSAVSRRHPARTASKLEELS